MIHSKQHAVAQVTAIPQPRTKFNDHDWLPVLMTPPSFELVVAAGDFLSMRLWKTLLSREASVAVGDRSGPSLDVSVGLRSSDRDRLFAFPVGGVSIISGF